MGVEAHDPVQIATSVLRETGAEHHPGRNRLECWGDAILAELERAVFHDRRIVIKTGIDAGSVYIKVCVLGLVDILLHVIHIRVAIGARLLMEQAQHMTHVVQDRRGCAIDRPGKRLCTSHHPHRGLATATQVIRIEVETYQVDVASRSRHPLNDVRQLAVGLGDGRINICGIDARHGVRYPDHTVYLGPQSGR